MTHIPPPSADTVTVAVEVAREDMSFLDNIVQAHDGIAQVRWDYRLIEGRPCYEIQTTPHFLDDTLQLLERLKAHMEIGLIRVVPADEGKEAPSV